MKKLLSFLLAASLVFSLSSCGPKLLAGSPDGTSNFYVILLIILCVALVIALIIVLSKYLKTNNAYSEIVRRVISADQYLKGKEAEAENLIKSAKDEGAKYCKEITDAAEKYSSDRRAEADSVLSSAHKEANEILAECSSLTEKRSDLQKEITDLNQEMETLKCKVFLNSVQIDQFENLRSDEIKNQLTMLRGRQDELIKSGKALSVTSFDDKRTVESQKKQILRCFNAECGSILDNVTVKNIDASRAKIQRSFETINRIFSVDGVAITQKFLSTKFDELSLIYAYIVKEEEEREQRRAIREQMVEEEKVRRELERAKLQIEKEETQFSNEVNKLMQYLQHSKDEIERKLYLDKINELQDKLRALESDKENIIERENNTRAGFVYIISNIGSFGEDVFKIGMTRRLEPMDRIAELSSASVPFPFDVHAMIFSDDAPGLEAILHKYFDSYRVNRVNQKKEFFHIDLEEIKKVVLENHNATVKFVDIPDALEYRETLRINEAEDSQQPTE